jgi:hydrogenase large subunit
VAGGTTNAFRNRKDFDDKCDTFRSLIETVGTFVVREYIPTALALGALYPEFDNINNAGGHGWGGGLGNFLAWGGFPQSDGTMALNGGAWVDATAVSPAKTRLLENRDGLVTAPGSLLYAKKQVEDNLKEFITCSRYENTHGYETSESAYPGDVTRTEPKRDDVDKYSWLKAPRWDGYAMEVGPLARMVINGKYPVTDTAIVSGAYATLYTTAVAGAHLTGNGVDLRVLDRDLVSGLVGSTLHQTVTDYIAGACGGLSTMDRLRARAIESFWMVAFLIGAPTKNDTTGAISFPAAGGWVGQLQALGGGTTVPEFYRTVQVPVGISHGYGLVEAPRGALGHFATASAGKLVAYQCVVPTTWNASPKDGTTAPVEPNVKAGTHRGAMEESMIDVVFDNTAMDGSVKSSDGRISGVEVLRVAQSFDPCIACAVH